MYETAPAIESISYDTLYSLIIGATGKETTGGQYLEIWFRSEIPGPESQIPILYGPCVMINEVDVNH